MKITKEKYEEEVKGEKSHKRFEKPFAGAPYPIRSEVKSIRETQLEEGAIQKVNYKMGIFKDGVPVPLKERKELHEGKRRFLRNVARAIKIAQLERKACEEKLTDNEKLQLIKLDREFDYFNTVLTLERLDKERRERQIDVDEPLTNTWKEASSDPHAAGEKKEGYEGKIRAGGKSEGEERRLKAILINHKKAIGWSEKEYKEKVKLVAVKRGGARTARLSKKRKAAGKKGIGGRKKGTKFDANLGRYVTAKERGKNG